MSRDAKEMSLWEHLEDLRWTLLKMIAILALSSAVALFFVDDLMRLLMLPAEEAREANPNLVLETILTTPFDGFIIVLKTSLIGGVAIAFPFLLYFIWSFVSFGLSEKENKAFIWICLTGTVAFVSGMYCSYSLAGTVLSIAVRMGPQSAKNYWALKEYFSFIFYWLILGGIIFEIPLAIIILSYLGVVKINTLRKIRAYFYIASLIAAALITPPDPLTMFVVAIPLIFLFEFGIFASSIINR